MSTSPPTESVVAPDFICECEPSSRSACAGEHSGYHEGKLYCVLHLPQAKKSAFKNVFEKKLENKDFDFRGVWFPDELSLTKFRFTGPAYFNNAHFNAAVDFSDTNFSEVTHFWGTTFVAGVDFRGARFSEVHFRLAKFNETARFSDARFNGDAYFRFASFSKTADFRFARFKNVNFGGAQFYSSVHFTGCEFGAASFRFALFEDHVRFAGRQQSPVFTNASSLDLQFARIEKRDRLSFHTITLRPHWFINVDAREFEFVNVEWDWRSVNDEIKSRKTKRISSPYRMLAIACRNLGVNAEENHRYEEASKFRYMAMDARRLEHWRGLDFRSLSWWYWLASGYGERVLRALIVLIGIFIVSAALYTQVGFSRWEPRAASESDLATKRDEVGAPMPWSRALNYSGSVMTFQRPEPRPATPAAHTIVLLETILGPLQAALLALAIRRKFMR